MSYSQFSLLWNAHKKNICNGLSSLQQNGEFVDMTLAADGHLVKVHQVIIALASPYIKELIRSAQCQHPVIFLNKVSYTTLSAILEYVYTGEVVVDMEHLNAFIEAGKELHIKGLEDMKMCDYVPQSVPQKKPREHHSDLSMEVLNDDICYFEVASGNDERFQDGDNENKPYDIHDVEEHLQEDSQMSRTLDNTSRHEDTMYTDSIDEESITEGTTTFPKIIKVVSEKNVGVMQYTVSNQGSLQMILNRYIYYLKHTNRNNSRQWRCVDYVNGIKCPAHVFTKDDVVIQRIAAHTHPFHDKKILKKIHNGAVFTAFHEAEKIGKFKKSHNNMAK